jgi:hypothetical protein
MVAESALVMTVPLRPRLLVNTKRELDAFYDSRMCVLACHIMSVEWLRLKSSELFNASKKNKNRKTKRVEKRIIVIEGA